jgi:aspartyl-tRNA synthetase
MEFRRSHQCGELRESHVGERVILGGWIHRRRDHGGLIFIDLRDRYGVTQLVFDPREQPTAHAGAEKLRLESVIGIEGTVVRRGEAAVNGKLPTGMIEIRVDKLRLLSEARPTPFPINEDSTHVSDEVRLKYRYLEIRQGELARTLQMRHQVTLGMRRFFDCYGFVEVQTPILAKTTPEGARDYLVPSRLSPGHFYALPQSPQIFKQLLMVAGMDRYFQIAPCFRDEDLRADRQPEFYQLDLEMSFTTRDELFDLLEELMVELFRQIKGIELPRPFPRIPFKECLERFGSDKPDLRYGLELVRLDAIAQESQFQIFHQHLAAGGCVKAMRLPGLAEMPRRQIDEYTQFVTRFGLDGLAWVKVVDGQFQGGVSKFFQEPVQKRILEALGAESGDLIFMAAQAENRVNQGLDHLRRRLGRELNLIPDSYNFLWVTDFPQFEWNDNEARVDFAHNPFAAPHPDDLHLMDTEPLKMRASTYDLVLNGYELGTGSQRIHDPELQRRVFELIQLTPEQIQYRFGFFTEALQYGTPPHRGIGLGLDRLIMVLAGSDTIRDVIAFPKTQKGTDLMMDAPSLPEPKQLDELHLSVRLPKE